jgi:hypothetical protein
MSSKGISKEPRWACEMCGRMVSRKQRSPNLQTCQRCERKKFPNLYTLSQIPNSYFEYEKYKVEEWKEKQLA